MLTRCRTYSIALISLFLCGCGGEKADTCVCEYDLSAKTSWHLADIFSDVEIVPLEFAGDFYPYGVAELQVSNQVMALLDNRKSLHIFSHDGQYIGC